jgi:hypothetical protein
MEAKYGLLWGFRQRMLQNSSFCALILSEAEGHRSGASVAGGVKTERQRDLANRHAIDSSVLMPSATDAMLEGTQLEASYSN